MSCKAIPDPAEWAARFSGLIVRQQDPSGSFLDQGLTSRQGQDGKRGGTQRAIATARASRRKPSRTNAMPKIKTHRGAAKRFRKTASATHQAGNAHRSHILTNKPTKRKRTLRQPNHAGRSEDPTYELPSL